MRRLYINGELSDIDISTAIGIDLQSYDVKTPAKRYITVSNTFSIPATGNNLRLVGFVNGMYMYSKYIYGELLCDYYIDNTQYINSARVRVQGIRDRIELFIFEKADIWDSLKALKWGDFVTDFINWIPAPKRATPFTGTFSQFIAPYCLEGGQYGIYVPAVKGYEAEAIIDKEQILGTQESGYPTYPQADGEFLSGSHFGIKIKTIFRYIEDKFNVNFYTDSTFSNNIWNDPIASDMFLMMRDLTIGTILDNGEWFFTQSVGWESESKYLGFTDTSEHRDKSLYDLVLTFFQYFNVIVHTSGTDFKLRRFDDMTKNNAVIDFSGRLEKKPLFKPLIEGYGKKNYITFKTVEEGVDPLTNQRILTSMNKSADEEKSLFSIDCFIPLYSNKTSGSPGIISEYVPLIDSKQSCKTFKLFVTGNLIIQTYSVVFKDLDITGTHIHTANLRAAVLYSLNGEYALLDSAIKYPVWIEPNVWLSNIDIMNFDPFKLYFFRELGGSFFINKIKGFNPDLSKQSTAMELIKVSDRTPFRITGETDVNWVDGVTDIWTDGVNNNFYTF